jgi:hypothetical protein
MIKVMLILPIYLVTTFTVALAQLDQTVYGNASVLEIIWTVMNALGFIRTYFNYKDARAQYREAAEIDKASKRIGRKDMVIQIGIGVYQVLCVVLGTARMQTPPSTVPQIVTVGSLVTLVCLIGGSAIFWALSEYITYERHRINADIAEAIDTALVLKEVNRQ